MVDHDSDEELVKVDAKAAEAIDRHCDQGPVACIQVRHLLHSGGFSAGGRPGYQTATSVCVLCLRAHTPSTAAYQLLEWIPSQACHLEGPVFRHLRPWCQTQWGAPSPFRPWLVF